MEIIKLVACAVVAYLVGNIQTSIILSKIKHDDIRSHGSGNAGSTNVVRVYGIWAGLFTLACDLLKAFVAVGAAQLISKIPTQGVQICSLYAKYIAGIFVVLGHVFPAVFGFKGGKGVATSLGAVWVVFGICLGKWWIPTLTTVLGVGMVVVTNMVSVGSLTGALVQFVGCMIWSDDDMGAYILSFVIFALLFICHRKNIIRIVRGEERKFITHKDNENQENLPPNEDSDENIAVSSENTAE